MTYGKAKTAAELFLKKENKENPITVEVDNAEAAMWKEVAAAYREQIKHSEKLLKVNKAFLELAEVQYKTLSTAVKA